MQNALLEHHPGNCEHVLERLDGAIKLPPVTKGIAKASHPSIHPGLTIRRTPPIKGWRPEAILADLYSRQYLSAKSSVSLGVVGPEGPSVVPSIVSSVGFSMDLSIST